MAAQLERVYAPPFDREGVRGFLHTPKKGRARSADAWGGGQLRRPAFLWKAVSLTPRAFAW